MICQNHPEIWGETALTADPYAVACGRNGRRSMAADLARTDPKGFDRDGAPPLPPENMFLYYIRFSSGCQLKIKELPESSKFRKKFPA